ncbi:MAG: 3-phosphoshikimate 1-carboxyvinyltransferase [Planctomycetota bacterium]
MSNEIEIKPCGPIHGSIRPPGSKSITNRALVCAALASGTSTLTGALDSDDTRYMLQSLSDLGITATLDKATHTVTVDGCGGTIPADQADLFIGNSGTTVRFLTAMLGLGQGTYRLDGVERMRQRPIQDLLDALDQLGVNATSELGTGAPPVIVKAAGIAGGSATVAGNISSQYLSGLLMAAPYAKQPVKLQVEGELVSKPYVEMTLAVMRSFAVDMESSLQSFDVPNDQHYEGQKYAIEPDASAASYFWAAAAITGGKVTVEGLSPDALQGDVGFCDCLEKMGCTVTSHEQGITVTGGQLKGIDIDMNAISDTVQTLAAVALFADGPTRVRGVAHNRHKETDRIGDLATELRRVGATVDEHEDGMTIHPAPLRSAKIETYDDHRMAMSLALIGLKQPGITILDPGCTAKTYPHYFDDLEKLSAG